MYRQLTKHRNYIQTKLADKLTKEEQKRLYKYHIHRVRDFQHERLIHLLVTFFFAGLMIGAFVAWLMLPFSQLFWPLTALVAILFILEIAYIRHYYQLENGVQSLYVLTEKLGKNYAAPSTRRTL